MINSKRRLMAAMSLVKNGGEAERRDVLLSLLLRRAASNNVSTGNVFIHKAVPFFCVLKKVTNAVIPTLKKNHTHPLRQQTVEGPLKQPEGERQEVTESSATS